MNLKSPDTLAERVQLARIWLCGFSTLNHGIYKNKRVEEFTSQDKLCRQSLAQILVDGDAPREILDLLATLIVPDSDTSPKANLRIIGSQMFRSGNTNTDLALTGSDEVLRLHRRDRRRYSDGHVVGSIIALVREKTKSGISLEKAFFEVSERAEAAGIEKMSPRNVKKIWNESREFREKLFGARK